jgi:hypothetical protein
MSFWKVPPLVFEILRCENTDFAVKWFSHWRRDPGGLRYYIFTQTYYSSAMRLVPPLAMYALDRFLRAKCTSAARGGPVQLIQLWQHGNSGSAANSVRHGAQRSCSLVPLQCVAATLAPLAALPPLLIRAAVVAQNLRMVRRTAATVASAGPRSSRTCANVSADLTQCAANESAPSHSPLCPTTFMCPREWARLTSRTRGCDEIVSPSNRSSNLQSCAHAPTRGGDGGSGGCKAGDAAGSCGAAASGRRGTAQRRRSGERSSKGPEAKG